MTEQSKTATAGAIKQRALDAMDAARTDPSPTNMAELKAATKALNALNRDLRAQLKADKAAHKKVLAARKAV